MAYPLLVPREFAGQCLQFEQELKPLAGIVAPEVERMRGKGCLLWKGSEVFVTDDNPPALADRLRAMHVEVVVVGPVDWDNLETWRVEAMKRLPINRWFHGSKSVSHASLMLSAAMDGKTPQEAMVWIRNAVLAGIISRRSTRWGPLYSMMDDYHPSNKGRRYGTDTAPRSRGRPKKDQAEGSWLA